MRERPKWGDVCFNYVFFHCEGELLHWVVEEIGLLAVEVLNEFSHREKQLSEPEGVCDVIAEDEANFALNFGRFRVWVVELFQ